MRRTSSLSAAKTFPLIVALLPVSSTPAQVAPTDADLQKSVERKVAVSENNTIFTLFCLLNVGGYNEENNSGGMHPVRVKVRERLSHTVPPALAQRIRDFYREHPHSSPYDYAVVAMSTGGAPDFKFSVGWPQVSKEASFAALSDLPALLRELYANASIEEIYSAVHPDYLAYIEQYRAAVLAEVAKVMKYCRVTELSSVEGGEVSYAVVIPNLLESFSNAFSFVLDDALYSVEGPQPKIGYNPHEFVHSITNPISYDPRYRTLQQPAQPLYDLAKSRPEVADLKNLQNFFDENLVRAISLRYLNTGDPARAQRLQDAVIKEYRRGYTLEPFFYEQLADYEKTTETLNQFYPTMLKRLNVEHELARWKQ